MLADALTLAGQERAEFLAASRGRAPAAEEQRTGARRRPTAWPPRPGRFRAT